MGSQAYRRLACAAMLAAVLSAGCAPGGDGTGNPAAVADMPEATPAAGGAGGSGLLLRQATESPDSAEYGGGPDKTASPTPETGPEPSASPTPETGPEPASGSLDAGAGVVGEGGDTDARASGSDSGYGGLLLGPPRKLLGYEGLHRQEFPLEERDEVVVLADTVSVAGGVVRGLVHNLSETLYARNVVVTARTPGSAEALSWLWPLTVQPGERAPFEIEDWQSPQNPLEIAIEVTADLSPVLDISRSFDVHELVVPYEPPPEIGDDVLIQGFLRPPTSPPGLDELVMGQTIEDLRAYTAWLDADGAVTEVQQHRPHTTVYYGECCLRRISVKSDVFPPPPDKFPAEIAARDDRRLEGQPGAFPRIDFAAEKRDGDYQVWFGGANPPPDNQPGNSPDG